MNKNSVVLIVLTLVVIGGLGFYFNDKQNKDCRADAVEASVLAYPPNRYPDLAERSQLQRTVENQYIVDHCQ